MERREFLYIGPLLAGLSRKIPVLASSSSEVAERLSPIPETHFPSRLHEFVWRNWELANTKRLAKVLRAKPEDVLEIGRSMGLPEKRNLTQDQLQRIYVTVIRQNWHLLPVNQITELLGWTREKFTFTLKEDDFLSVKLGDKPECAEVFYHPPSAQELMAAHRVRDIIRQTLGKALDEEGEQPFHFVSQLSSPFPVVRNSASVAGEQEVDLTREWCVIQPNRRELDDAARRLSGYLRTAMQADVPVERVRRPGRKEVRMKVDPLRKSILGGFNVKVAEGEVRLSAGNKAEVLEGLRWLQDRMELREGPYLPKGEYHVTIPWRPRYLYSYFAIYGDPLLDAYLDPFPQGYLERLARQGVDGVWLQAVLDTLAPSKDFPEFGAEWQTRLRNLNNLVGRARELGIRVFLYLNEPRAMPEAFFRNHRGVRGTPDGGVYAICTSVPMVRNWISDSLAHILEQVPDLGGFFCITMSENLTNCFSHGGAWGQGAPSARGCPTCSKRLSWDVIGELICTFRDGIRRSSSTADLMVWDWGWGDELAAHLIPLLPRDIRFLGVSEWDQPVHRGGVSTRVGEYSISVVGPGPRALRNWGRASERGIPTMAKVQFNNTWEISAVPYIPVVDLVAQHCENLSRAGINGIMASWTCGGFAGSPNLAAAKEFYFVPHQTREEILSAVASQRYGRDAAPAMVEAWKKFSTAFQEFPYGVAIYTIPTQHGPANLLRLQPTGFRASMILFPYDDLKTWSGAYPPSVVFQQFNKLSGQWQEGLAAFERGMNKVPDTKRSLALKDLGVAGTCYNHFKSTANQVQFYLLRERLRRADGEETLEILGRMKEITEDEIELAKRQFQIARRDSMIAYEASNHYYYRPLDLGEKILNCHDVIAQISARLISAEGGKWD